jgi:hypothetical protein
LQIIPPILTVVNASTGAPICDATLVSGDGGTALLSPCSASQGCSGTCQYTVNQEGSYGPPFTVTVTAPTYGAAVTPELTTETCGCEGACASAQQATVKLQPYISPPAMPTCPTSEPSSADSCTAPGTVTCEYGTNPEPDCNDLWQCVAGHWSMSNPGACPPQATCPSTAPTGTNSTCTANQQTCPFADATCVCTSDPGGLPREGGPYWDCIPITAGCPGTRPDLGTPCSASDTLDCDYGQCSGGVGVTCQDGTWQLGEFGCPA